MTEATCLLEGRTCIVSGVGPGIGASVARACAREGGRVVMAARSADYLTELKQEMVASGADVLAVPTDVRVAEDCERLVALAASHYGSVDVLVNNAALTDSSYAPVAEANLADWRRQFEVNLFGALQLSQRAIERMAAQRDGSIVFVNSMIIRKLRSNQGGYAASKAALLTASQALAREVGRQGIRVNSVVPGWIWGPSVQRYAAEQARERGVEMATVYGELAGRTALRLLPTPEDIAEAVVFLASERARAITGQTLDVNGGEVFA